MNFIFNVLKNIHQYTKKSTFIGFFPWHVSFARLESRVLTRQGIEPDSYTYRLHYKKCLVYRSSYRLSYNYIIKQWILNLKNKLLCNRTVPKEMRDSFNGNGTQITFVCSRNTHIKKKLIYTNDSMENSILKISKSLIQSYTKIFK